LHLVPAAAAAAAAADAAAVMLNKNYKPKSTQRVQTSAEHFHVLFLAVCRNI